jgi:hypothetical protein
MSAHTRHAKSKPLKGGEEYYRGPPSKKQLSVMVPWMQHTDDLTKILSRIADVGPIAQYILAQHICSGRLDQRTAAIRKIKKSNAA